MCGVSGITSCFPPNMNHSAFLHSVISLNFEKQHNLFNSFINFLRDWKINYDSFFVNVLCSFPLLLVVHKYYHSTQRKQTSLLIWHSACSISSFAPSFTLLPTHFILRNIFVALVHSYLEFSSCLKCKKSWWGVAKR